MTNKNTRRGFTLIELLVVVLIIGILAAVAVPQYQFAMDKSRVAPYVSLAYEISRAEGVYLLANGEYTSDFTALDVDFTNLCPKVNDTKNQLIDCLGGFNFNFALNNPWIQLNYCQSSASSCVASSNAPDDRYHLRLTIDYSTNSILYCKALSSRGQKLCKWLKPE